MDRIPGGLPQRTPRRFLHARNRQAMEAALAKWRSEFGREYALRIGGEWFSTAICWPR